MHYSGISTNARDMRNLLNNLGWGPEHYQRKAEVIKKARELVENHPVVKFWGWGGIGKSALAHKLLENFSDEMIQEEREDEDESPSGEYFNHFFGMSSKINSPQGDFDVKGSGRLKKVDYTSSPFVPLLADSGSDDHPIHDRIGGAARRVFEKIVNMFDPEASKYDDDQLREKALEYLKNERILFVLDNLEDLSDPQVSPNPSQSEKETVDTVRREYEKIKKLINDLENLGIRKVKSRIIITTRIHTEAEGLGRPMEVPRLDKDEALDLFLEVIEKELKDVEEVKKEGVDNAEYYRKLYQVHNQVITHKQKIKQIFKSWDSGDANQGAHPLIVISAAHSVTEYSDTESCLDDWKKGNKKKQQILVYCCEKLIGSMTDAEKIVVENIVKNRDIIGKLFFTFDDLERYEVFPGSNYAENMRMITKFVGWNWVRIKSVRTQTFYHWLPEIVESIHTSLGIEPSDVFGSEWSASSVSAISHPKPTTAVELRKISEDSILLERWKLWLDAEPDLTKPQGHTMPWKESQKHKDILYNVHSSREQRIDADSELIDDERTSLIYNLSKRTIKLFNETHTKSWNNREVSSIIAQNFEGVWRLYVKSSINLLSRIGEDTSPDHSAREFFSIAMVTTMKTLYDSATLLQTLFESDAKSVGVTSVHPDDNIVGANLTITIFELLKYATDKYSQTGFISNDEDIDNLSRWIEKQALILNPIPVDFRRTDLEINLELSSYFRDWLRIYTENEEKLSDSHEVRNRFRGYAFWISLRLYISIKPTESKSYDGAEIWRDDEFFLQGKVAAGKLNPLAVETHYKYAISMGGTTTKWIWEDEDLCIHISKGRSVSSGALVYVNLTEVRSWSQYDSRSAKPKVCIRCIRRSYDLPGIYLARVIYHRYGIIHCDVLSGEEGYLTEIPKNQISEKLDPLLTRLKEAWKTKAQPVGKMLEEINKVFPNNTELKWLNGEKTNNIVQSIVDYSGRRENTPTLSKKGGHVGFSVQNWPPAKPKYIETHADSAWKVIYGGAPRQSLAMPANPPVLARMIMRFEQLRVKNASTSVLTMTYEQLAVELMHSVEEQAGVLIPNTKPPVNKRSQRYALMTRILAMRNNTVYKKSKHSADDVVDWDKLPQSPIDFLSTLKNECISIKEYIQRTKRDKQDLPPLPHNFVQIIEEYFEEVRLDLP
jgi:hypothetical protein